MIESFRQRILAASAERPLRIRGGGSKDFYGGPLAGEALDMRGYAGIVAYEPSELVIAVRAGTALAEVETTLAAHRQFLPFEPPSFDGATVGGAVASGLSGPRRATSGALRDHVLGVTLLDGEGRLLEFGGRVIKNVAGYDVSRLIAGSLGTLGLILEVALKVLPRPAAETTLRFELPQDKALEAMNAWAGQPLPISASCWQGGMLSVRLSGASSAVAAASGQLGGERIADGDALAFWSGLREQRDVFFAGDEPVWRMSLPPVAPPVELSGGPLIEWGGAQRWLRGHADVGAVRRAAAAVGGHATLYRGGDKAPGVFQPLAEPLMRIHRRLKAAFDPRGVFNPGRLYPGL